MGYLKAGSTLVLSAYLTQKGREMLLTNKGDFQIKYFTLGDSDTNYFLSNGLPAGFVPDITGDNGECVKTIASNIDIKNKVNKD